MQRLTPGTQCRRSQCVVLLCFSFMYTRLCLESAKNSLNQHGGKIAPDHYCHYQQFQCLYISPREGPLLVKLGSHPYTCAQEAGSEKKRIREEILLASLKPIASIVCCKRLSVKEAVLDLSVFFILLKAFVVQLRSSSQFTKPGWPEAEKFPVDQPKIIIDGYPLSSPGMGPY